MAVTKTPGLLAAGPTNRERICAGLRGQLLVRNTSKEIIDKLNTEINVGLADPTLKVQLMDLGSTPLAGSPIDFGKLIVEETDKWGTHSSLWHISEVTDKASDFRLGGQSGLNADVPEPPL